MKGLGIIEGIEINIRTVPHIQSLKHKLFKANDTPGDPVTAVASSVVCSSALNCMVNNINNLTSSVFEIFVYKMITVP